MDPGPRGPAELTAGGRSPDTPATAASEGAKRLAAREAVALAESGMVLGLGTGSTSRHAVAAVGERLREGSLRDIIGIPTSKATAEQARGEGIPLGDLADHPVVDLAIDGADEIDANLDLVKGWGGALVREGIVAHAARRFAVIVDESKVVARLGTRGPVPVEVVPFAWRAQARWLAAALACDVTRREGPGGAFVTDNANFILDCRFSGGIVDPEQAADTISSRPGVVGHGLFLGLATDAFIGLAGGVRRLFRP